MSLLAISTDVLILGVLIGNSARIALVVRVFGRSRAARGVFAFFSEQTKLSDFRRAFGARPSARLIDCPNRSEPAGQEEPARVPRTDGGRQLAG